MFSPDPVEIARRLAIPFKKEDRPIPLGQPFDREIQLPTSTGSVKYSLVSTVQHMGSTGQLNSLFLYIKTVYLSISAQYKLAFKYKT